MPTSIIKPETRSIIRTLCGYNTFIAPGYYLNRISDHSLQQSREKLKTICHCIVEAQVANHYYQYSASSAINNMANHAIQHSQFKSVLQSILDELVGDNEEHSEIIPILESILNTQPPIISTYSLNTENKFKGLIDRNLWRFIIDGKDQNSNDPYIYDKPRGTRPGETGYFEAMRNAMQFMLHTLNEPLSPSLVLALHDAAIESVHLKCEGTNSSTSKNGIRSTGTGYELVPNLNISSLGLVEWLFCYQSLATFADYTSFNGTLDNLYTEMTQSSDHYFRCDPVSFKREGIHPYIVNKLTFLIDEYHQSMLLTTNVLDKILHIATFIHQCALLHPFIDGNIRTFVPLVCNKLLLMNGFPPAIFYNPNRFDGYSTYELLMDIVSGIKNVNQYTGESIDFEVSSLYDSAMAYFESKMCHYNEIKEQLHQITVTTPIRIRDSVTDQQSNSDDDSSAYISAAAAAPIDPETVLKPGGDTLAINPNDPRSPGNLSVFGSRKAIVRNSIVEEDITGFSGGFSNT